MVHHAQLWLYDPFIATQLKMFSGYITRGMDRHNVLCTRCSQFLGLDIFCFTYSGKCIAKLGNDRCDIIKGKRRKNIERPIKISFHCNSQQRQAIRSLFFTDRVIFHDQPLPGRHSDAVQ